VKIKHLTQVWVCSPNRTNVDGEFTTIWTYKGTEYLNLQQDLNDLDRNQMGEVDYSVFKGRTDKTTIITKGDGIYLTDVSSSTNPIPNFTVKGLLTIGKASIITLNKFLGV
jgi:hypothetical protein